LLLLTHAELLKQRFFSDGLARERLTKNAQHYFLSTVRR
jgi:hypothetical protein